MEKKTFIIAELSANHNHDLELTLNTVKAIAEAGANAVKVQTYTADSLSLDVDNEWFGPKKSGLWKGIRPYDLYKQGSLPYEWHPKIKHYAEGLGLIFFSTPFDFDGVDFLERLDIPMYKIASFEINDIPLIEYVAKKNKPVIISTGVADIHDIELAIETCRKVGNNDITLLKCTSQYPAKLEDANLLTMLDMKRRFNVRVGISDHTMGYTVPLVAVALGASVIEKHFTLQRNNGGVDAAFSMEPHEFKEMVEKIRDTEKCLGQVTYDVSDSDKKKRRSLFAIKDINPGDKFSTENIKSLRPGIGLSPIYYYKILGTLSKRYIARGDILKNEDLQE